MENDIVTVPRDGPVVSLLTSPAPESRSLGKSDGMCRSQFIPSKSGNIRGSYTMDIKKLGEGAYGSVSTSVHQATGAKRAVKTMSKGNPKHVQRFRQEINILKTMDHPNIIKLYETFEDRGRIYLVMELCEGKELFDRIIDVGHFTEQNAAVVMQQMLSAVFYMHTNLICHRDLKPENFLFASEGPIDKSVLKLIDFGLATRFQVGGGQSLCTKAGTAYYVAPQVLQGKYDQACDIWSCGVIMFTMLTGYPPFYGKTDQEVLSKVKRGRYSFDHKDWKGISDDAKTLIALMLKFNPEQRCTADQALQNTWIREFAPRAKNLSLQEGLVRNLRNFRSQNMLKKAALNIIAGQMSEAQIADLSKLFKSLDVNCDGLLTFEEMQAGIAKAELNKLSTSIDLKAILEGVDADGSGMIDYTEFLAATLDKKHYLQRDNCWAAFCIFDADGDGNITQEELQAILKDDRVSELMEGRSSAEILQDVDINGDGRIDFEEFMQMMQGGRSMSLLELTPKTGGCSPGAALQARSMSQRSLASNHSPTAHL